MDAVHSAEERAQALIDLVSTLRTADQVLTRAADLAPDDLERVAPDLVRRWLGEADSADPAAWARQVAADARVAAERAEFILKALAGRLVQSALGPGHIVPSAFPEALIAFCPVWAPSSKWYGLRLDRLPIDLRQLVRSETCPRVDGRPVLVLGAELRPAHGADEVLRFTVQARSVEDERDRRVREEEERIRLEAEFRRQEARRLRDLA